MAEAHAESVPAKRRRRSRRSTLLHAALVGASLVFSLLLLEGILRLTGRRPSQLFQPDSVLGATFVPNQRLFYRFDDGEQWIRTNAYGYQDRDWTEEKAPGTVRLALLGDSFVAGLEVPRDVRIGNLVEAQLNGSTESERRYEVLNFSVQGYGTAQELETLRHRALRFQPDIALIFFCTGNDWWDNSFELDPEKNRPHYAVDRDGSLVQLPFSVSDNLAKRWLRRYSVLYAFVKQRIIKIEAVHTAFVDWRLMERFTPVDERRRRAAQVGHAAYINGATQEVERAWQVTEALLHEASKVAQASGLRFGVVIIPMRWEIDGRAPAAWSQRALHLEKVRVTLAQICARQALECLDLTDAFRVDGRADEYFFENDGHWTERGHAVAARAVAAWVRERFLKDGMGGRS